MRVVSQNRDCSLDFNQTIFWRQQNYIYVQVGAESIAIGEYETSERAAEVFEDMHKAYSGMPVLFQNVEITEDLQQKLKEWKLEANCIVANLKDAPQKIEQIGNSVYYMPEV